MNRFPFLFRWKTKKGASFKFVYWWWLLIGNEIKYVRKRLLALGTCEWRHFLADESLGQSFVVNRVVVWYCCCFFQFRLLQQKARASWYFAAPSPVSCHSLRSARQRICEILGTWFGTFLGEWWPPTRRGWRRRKWKPVRPRVNSVTLPAELAIMTPSFMVFSIHGSTSTVGRVFHSWVSGKLFSTANFMPRVGSVMKT